MTERGRPAVQSLADGVPQLDPESRAWLESLRSGGVRYESAIMRLHSLLLSESRHQLRRRTAALIGHPFRRDPIV
jgi:hypothetical protein